MENLVLVVISLLLLIAYIADLTSSRTKIPSVIILFFLGWFIRQTFILFKIRLLNLEPLLPIFGTVGLILIVLEGSLELKLSKPGLALFAKSFASALASFIILSILLAILFSVIFKVSFIKGFINAIPFSAISSSIAIPSASNFPASLKEFVVYETSISDILGIIFFNFGQTMFENPGTETLFKVVFQLLIMIFISFLSTFLLIFVFSKITHHVKFTPAILLIILIYAISKMFHLPALIFILIFGLFLSNFREIEEFLGLRSLKFVEIQEDINKFKDLVIELTFLARSFFFLIFGYVMRTDEIIAIDSMLISSVVIILIYLSRYFQLILMKLPPVPMLFTIPRGLITILLFLSIHPSQSIPWIDRSTIIQVIVLTNIIMAVGLIRSGEIVKRKNLVIS